LFVCHIGPQTTSPVSRDETLGLSRRT